MKCGTDIFFRMTKIKLIFSFFFLLVFQAAFSSANLPTKEVNSCAGMEVENQIQFEENDHSPFIFGEVPAGQGQLLVYKPDTERFLSNFNAENLHIAILQSIMSSTATQGKTIYFGCSGYYIINIPIYLQTDNFRL